MNPKSWRISKNLTLKGLSKRMDGIDPSYISRVENGVKDASGRVLTYYHKLSKGRVSPADFKRKR